MPRLRSSLLLSLLIASSGFALPSSAHADSIEFGNPFYYVFNNIGYHRPGYLTATGVVGNGSDSNTTGNLSKATDAGFASAYGFSDPFHVRATSSTDGSQLAPNGFDSISSEGLAGFEIDFTVTSQNPQATVDLAYTLSTNFVSTDPKVPHQPGPGPGTLAGLYYMSIEVSEENQFVFGLMYDAGSYVLSALLDADTVYRLRIYVNAVSGVKESAGYASAASEIFASLSVPEPGTGLLVIAGLLGLAGWRRARA